MKVRMGPAYDAHNLAEALAALASGAPVPAEGIARRERGLSARLGKMAARTQEGSRDDVGGKIHPVLPLRTAADIAG